MNEVKPSDLPKIPEIKYEVSDVGDGRRRIVVEKIPLGAMGEWAVGDVILDADTTERDLEETVKELHDAFDRIFLKIAAAILTKEGENPYEALMRMNEMCEWAWSQQHAKGSDDARIRRGTAV